MRTVRVAVPRKGRPLEAVLDSIARRTGRSDRVDGIISRLRYEKTVAKGDKTTESSVYDRLATYSDTTDPLAAEFTLLRDDRESMPRRIVFDSVTISTDAVDLQLIGRKEPFRSLRTHEFAFGFDSADLVLEEVVRLDFDPLMDISTLNARIDPRDTDIRVSTGLGDTVSHTLLATPAAAGTLEPDLDRSFVTQYDGELCVSPRYERLVQAVLGTDAMAGIEFTHSDRGRTEGAAIAETGIGVYLTMRGSTARDHGLVVGEHLFPSETVLLENVVETNDGAAQAVDLFDSEDVGTVLRV